MGKKVALGTIAGFIALFALGALIYGVLLKGTMSKMAAAAGDCMIAEPGMALVAVATLVQAFLFTLLLHKLNANTFSKGLIAGAWVGFLIVLMYDIWFKASFPFFNISFAVADILGSTTMAALSGGVIGLVLGKVK